MRKILQDHKPVNIKIWTSKGEIQEYRNCVSLRINFYAGTRRIKLLESNQIRQVRDICIFSINDNIVYL